MWDNGVTVDTVTKTDARRLRVTITQREYDTIRKRAIDANLTLVEYVTHLLRKGLANDER